MLFAGETIMELPLAGPPWPAKPPGQDITAPTLVVPPLLPLFWPAAGAAPPAPIVTARPPVKPTVKRPTAMLPAPPPLDTAPWPDPVAAVPPPDAPPPTASMMIDAAPGEDQ